MIPTQSENEHNKKYSVANFEYKQKQKTFFQQYELSKN